MHQAKRVVACMLIATSLFGCGLLKKKKKSGDSTSATGDELNAANSSAIFRFPDETPLFGVVGTTRQVAFARTGPADTGALVDVIPSNTTVAKFADRGSSTLVTFDTGNPPIRRAGWISTTSFLFPSSIPTPPPDPTGGRCSLTLRVSGFIPSKAACQFNEKVRAGSPTTINFDCNGGGTFARFNTQTFAGSASRARVSLSSSESYPFGKCVYRSVQTITGTPPTLSYTYTESVVSGPCKESSSCGARATVTAL